MAEITVRAKYIFLDVVSYSTGRSAEAQADIIGVLNWIVDQAVRATGLSREAYLYLPTGDGICIAILDPAARYDLHLEIALSILQLLGEHNSATEDVMRCFEVRIGLNENVDNRVVDINKGANIAGAGINFAQRIMSAGDGGQIMVGDAVHATLRHHEKHMNSFRSYEFSAKHGVQIPVHQFIGDYPYLNVGVPARFRVEPKQPAKLSKHAAYYIAHSIRNQDSITRRMREPQIAYAAAVLLSFLAFDSVSASERKPFDYVPVKTYNAGRATFDEQLDFYLRANFWMVATLTHYFQEKLNGYLGLFEDYKPVIANKSGRTRLKEEWPEIWVEFGFESQQTDAAADAAC